MNFKILAPYDISHSTISVDLSLRSPQASTHSGLHPLKACANSNLVSSLIWQWPLVDGPGVFLGVRLIYSHLSLYTRVSYHWSRPVLSSLLVVLGGWQAMALFSTVFSAASLTCCLFSRVGSISRMDGFGSFTLCHSLLYPPPSFKRRFLCLLSPSIFRPRELCPADSERPKWGHWPIDPR